MPAKKIDKKTIIDASITLIKNNSCLSARNIAKILNCSTGPIYYLYKNMQEIEKDLYVAIKEIFNNYVKKFTGATSEYKAYGLAFISFAKTEKQLFKHLYLDNNTLTNNPFHEWLQDSTIKAGAKSLNITFNQAKIFHNNMNVFTFGLAMMQYFDMNISDEEISCALQEEYFALIKLYKENKWVI